MVTEVTAPYQFFYDINGELLENGYIYVGTENNNAETNKVNIYWDEAQTITANQPLRTVNGIVVNNGFPSKVYVENDNYSLLIKNQQGTIIYSVLSNKKVISAKEVVFKNDTIAGGVPQNINIILSRIKDFKDFGVKGDGSTDDSVKINQAISSASNGAGFKFSEGQYHLYSGINLGNSKNITIEFDKNAVLVPKLENFDVMYSIGSDPSGYTNLSVDGNSSDASITLSSPISGASIGSWIKIISDGLINGVNTKQTRLSVYRKIVDISGNQYFFNYSLGYDFLVSDSARAGLATINENYTLIEPNINNFDFGSDLFSRGLVFDKAFNVNIYNPKIYGSKPRYAASAAYSGRTAILLNSVIDSLVENVNIESVGWYGVAFGKASENGVVRGGVGKDMRHFTDITWETLTGQYEGQPTNIKFIDLTAHNCTESSFSTHENGSGIYFEGNSSYRAGVLTPAYGFYIRNTSCRAVNNFAEFSSLDGFNADDSSAATEIINFEGNKNFRDGIRVDTYARIRGGVTFQNEDSGIAIGGGAIDGTTISDNNNYAMRHLYYDNISRNILRIRSVDAPSSARQAIALRLETGSGVEPQERTFLEGKNILTGYGDNLFSVTSGDIDKIPVSDKQSISSIGTASNPISGFIESGDWSSGVVTVITNAVRAYAGSLTKGALFHKIHFYPVNGSGTGQITESVIDGVSFTLTSSDASEGRRFYWYLGL